MTWNYRVMRRWVEESPGTLSEQYGIYETYYDADDEIPHSITEDAMQPLGQTFAELYRDINLMLDALKKPVLDYESREEI